MNSIPETETKKRKTKTEDQEDQSRNETICLPDDLALDIVSRLPITSLIRFSFVCLSWQGFSRSAHLVDLHLSRSLNNDPCLIFHCKHPLRHELYFAEFSDDHGNEELVRKLQTPSCFRPLEFNVVGSCQGILCLRSSISSEVLSIYNPFTKKYKVPPKSSEFNAAVVLFGFGFHPKTKEYKVIKMLYYPSVEDISGVRSISRFSRSEIEILNLSDNTWRYIGEVPYSLEKTSGLLVNGRLHWVSRLNYAINGHLNNEVIDHLIVSFDLSDELFREVPKPKFIAGQSRYNCQLVVLRGCLSAAVLVTSSYSSLDIWIMKEYDVKESWVKQFSIGGYLSEVISQNSMTMAIVKGLVRGRIMRVLCVLKDGEILLENKCGSATLLLSYNPQSKVLKKLNFPGMPNTFETIVHVGSLKWIDNK